MEELGLMQKFADPNLFEGLSQAEVVEGALVTTLMGMGITFIVLTLLWGIIALLTKVIQRSEGGSAASVNKGHSVPVQTNTPPVVATPNTAISTTAIKGDTELIAVITAAIAAAEGSVSAGGLVIRKISRISGDSNAWNKAGSREIIDSRKF